MIFLNCSSPFLFMKIDFRKLVYLAEFCTTRAYLIKTMKGKALQIVHSHLEMQKQIGS